MIMKFLGASVLSFSTSLGLGAASESTLSVDLVEDCGDSFEAKTGAIQIGQPVYFVAGAFQFNGILTSWTANQGSSGITFTAKISDPKQLLENATVIVDSSFKGGGPNVFNVYAYHENTGSCASFGASESTARGGMPLYKVIEGLVGMEAAITTPNGTHKYSVNWSSFPSLPNFYKVTGPGISVLQLLQDACDAAGLEFYVYLDSSASINVGYLDLGGGGSSNVFNIVNTFGGKALDISYGREIRNEKTKSIIFGEQQHYLTVVTDFEHYFGEDNNGNPITPIKEDSSGFWIRKTIEQLNAGLIKPLGNNGPYEISELDLRFAMSSYDFWLLRVLDENTKGSFNEAVRANYPECTRLLTDAINGLLNNPDLHPDNKKFAIIDIFKEPSLPRANSLKPIAEIDLDKIYNFILNLANTYYGVQFIAKFNDQICEKDTGNFKEKYYSDVPTGDGGWVDGDQDVLGLPEPELSFFRSDDYRINSFALFAAAASSSYGNSYGLDQ